jgi:pleckstrin homology domain-containing family G member 4
LFFFLLLFQNQAWYNGWPLAISGAVVLHLGSLDESLLRHHEIYLCIRTASDQCGPKLYAVWRTPRQSKIVYHPLDPDKEDNVSPTALEMLAEDLPQLLQSLLASVEREICRVPLDDLPFPTKDLSSRDPTVTDENGNGGEPQPSIDNRLLLSPTLTGSRRLECGLKRRELVTKNKTVNSKYALKRMASVTSGTDDEDKSEIDIQSRNMKNELICGGDNKHLSNRAESIALPPQHPTILAPGSVVNVSVAAATTTTTTSTTAKPPATLIDGGVSKLNGETTITPAMPLFCLGGSFPHIDSDEESGDDTKKTETGKTQLIILICT